MTIITALSDGKSVWVGYNNACTVGDTPIFEQHHWIYFGDWGLGLSGGGRQKNILEWNIAKLEKHSKTPLTVVNTIRNIFQDEGVSKTDSNSATPSFGMSGILVNKDAGVWDVDHRLALAKIQNNKLRARGSGIDYALGADFAALAIDPQLNHQQRVRIATEAAISCDSYCPGEAIISQFV
ncbi:MAG: hypothetical protein COA60_006260 [Robiginitomaculum sp.]|nr:hypothetical protein [Robiginitomaculum sp.]